MSALFIFVCAKCVQNLVELWRSRPWFSILCFLNNKRYLFNTNTLLSNLGSCLLSWCLELSCFLILFLIWLKSVFSMLHFFPLHIIYIRDLMFAGGQSSLADYCTYYVAYSDGSCTDVNSARAPDRMLGEVRGSNSRWGHRLQFRYMFNYIH